jgi:hypothetical protein
MESKNLPEKIEQVLQSLDGIQRAEPMPFFYTRLHARMQKEKEVESIGWMPVRKPVWLIATLFVFLLLNGIMIKQSARLSSNKHSTSETASLQSFASEFELNNTSNY